MVLLVVIHGNTAWSSGAVARSAVSRFHKTTIGRGTPRWGGEGPGRGFYERIEVAIDANLPKAVALVDRWVEQKAGAGRIDVAPVALGMETAVHRAHEHGPLELTEPVLLSPRACTGFETTEELLPRPFVEVALSLRTLPASSSLDELVEDLCTHLRSATASSVRPVKLARIHAEEKQTVGAGKFTKSALWVREDIAASVEADMRRLFELWTSSVERALEGIGSPKKAGAGGGGSFSESLDLGLVSFEFVRDGRSEALSEPQKEQLRTASEAAAKQMKISGHVGMDRLLARGFYRDMQRELSSSLKPAPISVELRCGVRPRIREEGYRLLLRNVQSIAHWMQKRGFRRLVIVEQSLEAKGFERGVSSGDSAYVFESWFGRLSEAGTSPALLQEMEAYNGGKRSPPGGVLRHQ